MRKIKESALLNAEEFDLIFDQIENIYDSNRNFFDSLQQRLNASKNLRFCDILLEHLRLMYPYYQKFFMKQIIAMEVLQNRLDSDKNFATLLREITSETRIHLPLVSYLIKPMQRITKYPLLLEKIYKNTPSSHPDYKDCQEALNFSKKICININEACRRMECFNKLDWIQRKVSFSKHRSLKLIDFNSETRFLGPRTLIRYGVLTKISSSSETLIGLLFNDFLMLIVPDRKQSKLSSINDIFKNKQAIETNYHLYRQPLLLNQFELMNNHQKSSNHSDEKLDSSSTHSSSRTFTIRLKEKDKLVTLKAQSPRDRTQWINDLHQAQQHYFAILNQMEQRKIGLQLSSLTLHQPIGNLFLTLEETVQIYTIEGIRFNRCSMPSGHRERLDKRFK
ncbi:Rho/RAC guanine nucleotide exchange factor-like protein 1 [Sarcoptes scabiei]|uniref:Rho/RAC guanine nucleotide exchange factor-like protein 1 n=1 Tax=Sarcoptes scabiei TaxID=52283 RepID=A0A132AHD0_SARSC|nr:Rho/RAC guanine nucleotide exchange factor-like protein 1 [Sarcoptes scabiei]